MAFMSALKVSKHYWERYNRRTKFDERKFGPVMLDLHPTLACQNKCYFCISANSHVGGIERPWFDRKHTLDWDVLKKVIEDLGFTDVESIQLTGGGEPTLYPYFGDLLEELHPHRTLTRHPCQRVGLITNGIKAGEYAKDILGACDWVRISLDASNPLMYRQIKGVNHFEEVLDSIKRLCELRGDDKKPRIGVAYILTPESLPGIVEVVQALEKLNIDYLQFKDVVNRGLAFTTEYRANIDKLLPQAKRMAPFPIYYTKHEGIFPRQQQGSKCDILDYVGVLGADGNVYGCCHLEYLPEASYGSIYDRSFQEIWDKKKSVKIAHERCWNCRFSEANRLISQLKALEDVDFL